MESHNTQYSMSDFHADMDQATHLHVQRKFQEVLELRQQASAQITGQEFTLDSPAAVAAIMNLSERGDQSVVAGNYRNIGATYERLGDDSSAVTAMEIALAVHQELRDRIDDAYINREVAAGQFYLGAFALKAAMNSELGGATLPTAEHGQKAVAYMRDSQASFAHADKLEGKATKAPHQYELNGLRRFSMAESLYGNKSAGLKLGLQAIRWSVTSEANRSWVDRRKAVIKAAVGGAAATAIAIASSTGMRSIALQATKKFL